MDPISQILSQAGGASAGGQGFGQFFAEGVKQGQENRRLNLMERRQQFEEQQQSKLMPLEMEAQRLNNERTGLAVQSAMKSMEQQNAVMSKMPDLIDLQTQFSTAPNGFQDPDLINRASTIFKQAPMLTETDIGKSILGGIQNAPKLDQAFKMFERMNRVTPEGTIPQSFDPQTGRMTFMAEPRAANQPANLQEASAITNLRRRIAQTTDPAIKADLEMELNDVLNTTGGKSNIIRTNPDGTTEVIMGANVGDLTASQRGQNVQQSSKLVDSARRIADIIPKVNEIFGPANAAKTVVVDRTLSNINPNWADGERIQGRAAAGFAMENILRSMNEGMGAMSNADVVRLKAKFPELNNVSELMESPVRAEEILLAVTKELTRDAYVKSRLTGNALDQDSLRLLDPMFLAQELTAGRISKEAYREAIKSSIHTKEITRLLNQKNKQKAP